MIRELAVGAVRPEQGLDPVRRCGRKIPEKVKELDALFWEEAENKQVLPLDTTTFTRRLPRPNLTAGRTVFTYSGEVTGYTQRQRAERVSRPRPTTSRPRSRSRKVAPRA
jgi:hypothetical protein